MKTLNATTKWTVWHVKSKIQPPPQQGHVNSTTKWNVQKFTEGSAPGDGTRLLQLDKGKEMAMTSQTLSSATDSNNQCKSEFQVLHSTGLPGECPKDASRRIPSSETSSNELSSNELSSNELPSYETCSQPWDDQEDSNTRCASKQQNKSPQNHSDVMDRHFQDNIINSEADVSVRTKHLGFRGTFANNESVTSKEEVPVQHWDHYIKDLSKSIRKSKMSASQTVRRWDGSRRINSAEVVASLLKEKSLGFGDRVLSWEGSRSVLDEDKVLARNQDCRKHWLEHYEEELDRGKTKKVKKKYIRDTIDGQVNLFQSYQNFKNMEKKQNVLDNHRLRS